MSSKLLGYPNVRFGGQNAGKTHDARTFRDAARRSGKRALDAEHGPNCDCADCVAARKTKDSGETYRGHLIESVLERAGIRFFVQKLSTRRTVGGPYTSLERAKKDIDRGIDYGEYNES